MRAAGQDLGALFEHEIESLPCDRSAGGALAESLQRGRRKFPRYQVATSLLLPLPQRGVLPAGRRGAVHPLSVLVPLAAELLLQP